MRGFEVLKLHLIETASAAENMQQTPKTTKLVITKPQWRGFVFAKGNLAAIAA